MQETDVKNGIDTNLLTFKGYNLYLEKNTIKSRCGVYNFFFTSLHPKISYFIKPVLPTPRPMRCVIYRQSPVKHQP